MNKNPIFSHGDFKLCEVPVPDGYPQSQTHVGVGKYNGKLYLTTSPYPGPRYNLWIARMRKLVGILSSGRFCSSPSAEIFENPCLYIGEEGNNNMPTQFRLMQKMPLMETPEEFYGVPSYNSDPDIFIENGIIHILNRSVIRTKVYKDKPYEFVTRIYLMRGKDENGHFKLLSNQLVLEGEDNYVSPSLVKFRSNYMVSFLDNHMVSHKVLFKNLYLSTATSVEEAIRAKNRHVVQIKSGQMTPWHMSLFHYSDTLYAIVTCVREGDTSLKMWQMLGEFNQDLSELTIYPTPLTDYNSYRGSAFVRADDVFILYSTIVWEKIAGSKSVDGRDVIVASCKFSDFLARVREER